MGTNASETSLELVTFKSSYGKDWGRSDISDLNLEFRAWSPAPRNSQDQGFG